MADLFNKIRKMFNCLKQNSEKGANFKYCSNCGNKLTNEQKFCEKCGAEVKKRIIVEKKHLLIGLFLISIFIAAFAIFTGLKPNIDDTQNLYKVYDYESSETIFIDESGNEYLTIKDENNNSKIKFINKDKTAVFEVSNGFINICECSCGRVFVYTMENAEFPDLKKENCIVNHGILYLFDKNGKLIKKFKENFVSIYNSKEQIDLVPYFYKGYAKIPYTDKSKISKISDIKYMYVNQRGNVVKNVPLDIKQVLDKPYDKKVVMEYSSAFDLVRINSGGKVVWSSLKPLYIYDIKNNRWFKYNKRLGNKYIRECVYVYATKEDVSDLKFVNENFEWMYDDYQMSEYILSHITIFNTITSKVKDNRFFIFDAIDSGKLYEFKYNKSKKNIFIAEVTDKSSIENFFSNMKLLYTSQFKKNGRKMTYSVTANYPQTFMIYNDGSDSFYKYYFEQNNNVKVLMNDSSQSFFDILGFVVLKPTTVRYMPNFEEQSVYEITFK